ncbi:hypothetical protein CBR_g19605 [Chara braunii]|uniref:Uncharacterized protein n=1 Tax=Chara braunii TaxID=69332 RepID=A0A388KYN4_CHABU|nr:hypothetical protein CBR_g19605 [Chara braunii]|eukprot:GBG75092.1 hypothetical protein CBR_g19605 [Chara braunii]
MEINLSTRRQKTKGSSSFRGKDTDKDKVEIRTGEEEMVRETEDTEEEETGDKEEAGAIKEPLNKKIITKRTSTKSAKVSIKAITRVMAKVITRTTVGVLAEVIGSGTVRDFEEDELITVQAEDGEEVVKPDEIVLGDDYEFSEELEGEEFEQGEVSEDFRKEEYDGFHLETRLLLSGDKREKEGKERRIARKEEGQDKSPEEKEEEGEEKRKQKRKGKMEEAGPSVRAEATSSMEPLKDHGTRRLTEEERERKEDENREWRNHAVIHLRENEPPMNAPWKVRIEDIVLSEAVASSKLVSNVDRLIKLNKMIIEDCK